MGMIKYYKYLIINNLINVLILNKYISLDLLNHIFINIKKDKSIYYIDIIIYLIYPKGYLFSNQRNKPYIPIFISPKYITKKSV